MDVTIDTNCRHVTLAGTTRYVNGLISAMRTLPDIKLHEIAWQVDNLDYNQPMRALKTLYRERFWAPYIAKWQLSRRHTDVFHSPAGYLIEPPPTSARVVTLHDLAIVRHPERFRLWKRKTGFLGLQRACQANHIITVSRFTADEAMEVMGIGPERLYPIHHGCDFTIDAAEAKPTVFVVPSEFFLFVGSIEPGKNLALLRETYLLGEKLGTPLPPLIVVGARWEGVEHEGEWPQNWIGAGRIPDDELVFLYRRASALLFPSKYEGFGFPLVEAMTLGCPVICSPVASLSEIVESAAMQVPLSPEAYLRAANAILKDSEIRLALIAHGYERAKQFSWEKCARETAEIYKLAMEFKHKN
jgi:alpha-1,3-rhamnosyl/mannosyltransferase